MRGIKFGAIGLALLFAAIVWRNTSIRTDADVGSVSTAVSVGPEGSRPQRIIVAQGQSDTAESSANKPTGRTETAPEKREADRARETFRQLISSDVVGPIAGKKVRLEAYVKAQDVTETAELRLRSEDRWQNRNLYEATPATGTYEWKKITVEATVPEVVGNFSYGLTFRSSGRIWLSHPTFEIF